MDASNVRAYKVDQTEGDSYRETDSGDRNQRRDERGKENSDNDEDQRDRYRVNALNVHYSLCLNIVVESRRSGNIDHETLIADDVRNSDVMPNLWNAIHRVWTVRLEIDDHEHRVVFGRGKLGIDVPARLYRICEHVVVPEDLLT